MRICKAWVLYEGNRCGTTECMYVLLTIHPVAASAWKDDETNSCWLNDDWMMIEWWLRPYWDLELIWKRVFLAGLMLANIDVVFDWWCNRWLGHGWGDGWRCDEMLVYVSSNDRQVLVIYIDIDIYISTLLCVTRWFCVVNGGPGIKYCTEEANSSSPSSWTTNSAVRRFLRCEWVCLSPFPSLPFLSSPLSCCLSWMVIVDRLTSSETCVDVLMYMKLSNRMRIWGRWGSRCIASKAVRRERTHAKSQSPVFYGATTEMLTIRGVLIGQMRKTQTKVESVRKQWGLRLDPTLERLDNAEASIHQITIHQSHPFDISW